MINGNTFISLGYEGKQIGECLGQVDLILLQCFDLNLLQPSDKKIISEVISRVGLPLVKLKKG